MSSYSDFFGVGSSGGSGAFPINSYLGFTVSATNNPTGYDATTGLYTHPDGTFWLRTGFTINDTTNTYPDATVNSVSFAHTLEYNRDTTVSGDNYVYWDDANNLAYVINDAGWVEFNATTGVATGNTATYPAFVLSDVYYSDGTYVVAQTAGGVGRFDFATGTQNGATIAGFEPNAYVIAKFDGTSYDTDYVMIQAQGSNVLNAVQLSTWTSTASSYSKPGSISGYRPGTAISSGQIHISHANFTINVLDLTGTQIGTYDPTSAPNLGVNPRGKAISYSEGLGFFTVAQANATPVWSLSQADSIGDGTARTDSDTTQPMFVRIK